MEWYELAEKLLPFLKKGNLELCISKVISDLEKEPPTPFHIVTELNFTNSPRNVANYIQDFITRNELEAIYIETNGFDINPEQWYFELFGYDNYGTLDDLDWLSDWQAQSEDMMVLTGMETLQKVYASEAFENRDFKLAKEYCSLLVVLKFQMLIRESCRLIDHLSVPIFATSHDYDFIFEVEAPK